MQELAEFHGAIEQIVPLGKCLAVQFSDLRSQIVKEASSTVSALSKRFGADFMGLAPTVLPAMLRVLKSNKGVMYSASHDAIVDICDSCCVEGMFALFCTASDDKHPSVREHVMRYIARMLANPASAQLSEETTDKIEIALKRTVVDASAPVRVEAKNAFVNYKRAYPVEAALLLATLDATVQKKLESGSSSTANNAAMTATALSGAGAGMRSSSTACTTPMTSIAMDNVRERILKARLNTAVVPVSGVVWEMLDENSGSDVHDCTPPKSGTVENVPTPQLPEAGHARFVHYVKEHPHTACPQSTPAKGFDETTASDDTLPLLKQASATLRSDYAGGDPHPTPDKIEMEPAIKDKSPGALLLQAALCLQVSQLKQEPKDAQAEVKIPVVTEEKPTFESVKKAKKVRKPQRAQKENESKSTKSTKEATANKDSTPIAKRTRNRKTAVTSRVK